MIQTNLTHAEVGAFLMAIGQRMINSDLCADAVLDTLQDKLYRKQFVSDIQKHFYDHDDISDERCEELLSLTLEEAIEFVRLP